MACDIAAGIAKRCKDNLGGAGKAYIFNYIESPFTYAAGIATAINAGILINTVFEFHLQGSGNSLNQVMIGDDTTGTTVNTQTLNMYFPKQDAATSATMNLLAYGNAMVVVRDKKLQYHAVGILDGMTWQVTADTGGALEDANGYTVVGVGKTGELAPMLDTATIAALLALV